MKSISYIDSISKIEKNLPERIRSKLTPMEHSTGVYVLNFNGKIYYGESLKEVQSVLRYWEQDHNPEIPLYQIKEWKKEDRGLSFF